MRTRAAGGASAPPAEGLVGHDFSSLRIFPARTHLAAGLDVSKPGDSCEQEAERVSTEVMRMPDSGLGSRELARSRAREMSTFSTGHLSVRRAVSSAGNAEGPGVMTDEERDLVRILCPDCEEGVLVQRKGTPGGDTSDASAPSVDVLPSGPGEPLPSATREFFEPRFGYDFSQVRIHHDAGSAAAAAALGASAYTVGDDIVFGHGQYSTQSAEGRQLLAHELTHVVQQGSQPQRVSRDTEASPVIIRRQATPGHIYLHTSADCHEWVEECWAGCRKLPDRTRRKSCWARCMAEYVTCLASSSKALTFAAIVAAIVLVSADGPFPIGDAAAAALLLRLGISGSR